MNIPELRGIHHLKLAVSDLNIGLKFYEDAFGCQRIPQFDHHRLSDGFLYAYILTMPGLGTLLELRLNEERAKKHRFFDPITIAVEGRTALENWSAYLSGKGIKRSPIICSIQAWLIVVEDPDGNRLRLYTLETHGPELKPDETNSWLDN